MLFKSANNTIGDIANAVVKQLEYIHENGPLGIPSRFPCVNDNMGLYRPGEPIIVASRPSHGKSMFLVNEASHFALDLKIPTLLVSAEMTKEQVGRRTFGDVSNLSMFKYANGRATDAEIKALPEYLKKFQCVPWYVEDTLSTVEKVIQCIDQHLKMGVKIVLIDYVQLLKSEYYYETHKIVTEASLKLRAHVKQHQYYLFLAAQINRDTERNGLLVYPTMSMLKEAGQLEQDGGQIILLSPVLKDGRPIDKVSFKGIIAKNREGPTGEVFFKMDGDMQRWVDRREEDKKEVKEKRKKVKF